nr:unnamed protein product [Callosobruchus analis]
MAASLHASSSDWSSGLHTCAYFKACPIWGSIYKQERFC